MSSKLIEDWKLFERVVKKTKRLFFDDKIQEITLKNHKPQNLINWVRKCKLPAVEALQFNG